MRTTLVLGGTLALLAAALPGAAQSPPAPLAAPSPGNAAPTETTVIVPEATVHSGPGDKFYATGKLRQGDRVLVLRPSAKDANWLEIKPPPGSFSWVNSRFIKKSEQNPKIGLVAVSEGETVPVLQGSTVYGGEPNIESTKLERGALVIILEDTPNYAATAGASLVRIEATAAEVRYIPASCVDRSAVVQRAPGGGGPQTGSGGPGPAGGPGQGDELMQQAQRLYAQALADPRLDEPRRQQVLAALKQAQDIMRAAGTPGGTAAPQMPGNPNNVAAAPNSPPTRLVSQQGASGQNTTLYNAHPPAAPKPTLVPGQAQVKWSSWGTLRKAAFKDESGRPMYVLTDAKGYPLLYAVPEPGKTLDPYVDKMVALYGSAVYRSDEYIRNEFMTVSFVAPPQGPPR
jgi:hypothetical protein